jgi:predicted alpha/beta-fold hydrolase
MIKAVLGLTAVGALGYQIIKAEKPHLYYQPNPYNQQIIKALPQLHKKYAFTPWLANPHLQIAYYTSLQHVHPELHFDHIEQCLMPDGAITELGWLGYDLAENSPTILVLHTITANTRSMRALLLDLQRLTGWRVVLCLRRGHTLAPQPFSQINIMGSVPDFKLQIAQIHSRFPQSALYAVGSSAGSATLSRYLGEVGLDTPLKAAFAYCPGYDLTMAFDRVHGFYDHYLAKAIKDKFILPYRQHLQQSKNFRLLMQSSTVSEMQKLLYHYSGFNSLQEYIQACNPSDVLDQIGIPTMILNAEDDPICHIDNAKAYIQTIEDNPHLILVTTKHGSHCGHFEGWKPHSWANQLIADYLLQTEQHRIYIAC